MKEIKLTQGQVALVDDEDYELVSQYKWYARYNKDTQSYYALRNMNSVQGRHTLFMHRFIMGCQKGDKLLGEK